MLKYNTHLKKLILPEYGRNIQSMVDHCLTIADRNERTDCAYAIAITMETLFPPTGDLEEYRRKIWDHIAIMSDFNLDIDWPFEVIRADSLGEEPEPIVNMSAPVRYRQYGQILEAMVLRAAEMPESPEREALSLLLANHIKKDLLVMNPEGVEDAKVFADLRMLSRGAINFDPATTKLCDFKVLPPPSGKKKKKK